jgi:predicted GTPase
MTAPAGKTAPREVETLLADLDPAHNRMRDLLDRAACRDLAARLRDAVRAIDAQELRIVFGGHFSSGKSTLINTLLGRSLLPTDDLPETGVPCVVRSGTADRLQSVSATGRAGLPFSTESIAREVSLIDDDGGYRAGVHDLQRLVVSLAGAVPPPGVLWIDSPGINDTAAMTDRARSAAEAAHVLVWVVNSRQPLAEVEQEFLHEHVATHGPSSVVFVVNVFLADDTPTAWSTFLHTRAERHLQRILDADICAPLTSRVTMISARAAATDPDDFGGPQVRALLDELGADVRGHALAARCHRTAQDLKMLLDAVQTRITAERARLERARRQRDDRVREAARRQQRFAREITGAVARAYAGRAGALERCADPVVTGIRTGSLARDGQYGTDLTATFGQVADELHRELLADVRRIARAAGLPDLPTTVAAHLHTVVRPAPITVEVPDHPVGVGGRKSLGAIVGGVLGSLVLPGAGTALGAALGAGAGALADPVEAAVAKDRAGAEANAVAAAHAAAAALLATQQRVQDVLTDGRLFPRNVPPVPDDSALDALQALHHRLDVARARLRATTASAS